MNSSQINHTAITQSGYGINAILQIRVCKKMQLNK